MSDVWEKLKAEFPREAISWRAQSITKTGDKALALAYITSRDVMDRLDEAVGPGGWQTRYEFNAGTAICYLSIKVGDEWLTKADGAGSTDVEAEKGQLSDAFKRSAVHWGIARYLYDMPSPWVPCESYERNGKYTWSKWKDDPWSHVRGKPSQALTEPSKPSTPSPKTSESKQETKYPLKEEQRRHLWARMMDDLRKEAPKGADAMVRYMKTDETQKDLNMLEPWKNRFRTEAKDLIDMTRAAEGLIGENVASIRQINAPDFSNMNTEPVPDALDEILSQAEGKLNG